MNDHAQLLQQLRDIHTPEPIGWWPPAPGWWIFGVVILSLIAVSFLLTHRYYSKYRYRKVALKALQDSFSAVQGVDDNRTYLEAVSSLLRRVAIHAYGREKVSSLTGSKWLTFLDAAGNTDQFSKGVGSVLADGHYQLQPEINPHQIHALAQKWIKEHK